MSDEDYNDIEKSAAALRSVLRKNSARLKRDAAGKEVIEKAEEFVIRVETFLNHAHTHAYSDGAYVGSDYHSKLWFDTHSFSFRDVHETLAFRNVPLIIGGGTLGMIIGEKIFSISSAAQWILIVVGLLIGIGVASLKSDSSAAARGEP
jgi:hypothetical protein